VEFHRGTLQHSKGPIRSRQLGLEHQSTADIKNALMTPLNTTILLWCFHTANLVNDAFGYIKLFKEKLGAIVTANGLESY